jgi:hypothetical protein
VKHVKVYGRTIRVTEFAKSTTLSNKVLVITIYFAGPGFNRIHSPIAVLDFSLKKYTFDV